MDAAQAREIRAHARNLAALLRMADWTITAENKALMYTVVETLGQLERLLARVAALAQDV